MIVQDNKSLPEQKNQIYY